MIISEKLLLLIDMLLRHLKAQEEGAKVVAADQVSFIIEVVRELSCALATCARSGRFRRHLHLDAVTLSPTIDDQSASASHAHSNSSLYQYV